MINISIVDRKTDVKVNSIGDTFSLNGAKIVILHTSRSDISSMERQGNALIITLKSGKILTFNDFFVLYDENNSHLVINDLEQGGGLWWVEQPWNGTEWAQIESIEPLMIQQTSDIEPWTLWAAGGAALLGLVGSEFNSSGHNIVVGEKDTHSEDPIVEKNNASGLFGTSEPGSTIILVRPDGSKEGTVADENGNWKFEPNPLVDGESGQITARDPAGNVSNVVNTGPADIKAPDLPITNHNNDAELSGTGEPGATITLTKPNGDKETTVVDENGQWSFAPNPLNHGEEGKLTATDKAGNISDNASTGIADLVAPNAPVSDSNNNAGLSGTGEPGSTIILTKPNGKTETTIVGNDGKWSFQPNPLNHDEEGKLTATDKAGNTSDNASTGIADLIAPNAPVVDSNNNAGLNGTSEPGATIILTRPDGNKEGTTADENGQWRFEPNPLTEGEEGKLTATDEAGNTSGETSTGLADVVAPDVPTVDSNNASGLTGIGEAGATITLTKPNGDKETTVVDENGQWSFTPNPLTEGEEGKLTATDEAGNISGETVTDAADVTVPDAPAVDSNNASGLIGTGEAGATITLTKPNGDKETTVVDENGQWRFEPNPLTEGEEGKLTATDEAGNTSGETLTGSADVTAPDAPAVDSNNASGLIGTGEAGATITLTKPNGDKETTVVDENGQWSFAPNPLNDGEEGKLTATDEAGNISGEASTGTAVIDGPLAPVVDSNNGAGLTGTGEPGATITLTKPDGDKETTVVDENGQWSFAPNPLTEGEEGKLTATDEAGNTSGETLTGSADVTAPDAPAVDSNNASGLTGTGEPGTTITLTKPDGTEETTVVDENGQWSFAPNPLTEGEEGKLTATDEAGNISGEASTGTAVIDGPLAPVVDSNNGAGLTGTGEPGATITLTKPNGDKETTVVDENGQWRFEPNPLTEGEEGKLTATDEAGNISGETSTGLADVVAPDVPAVDSNNASGLTGTGEAGTTITLTKPNGDKETTVVDENGQWSFAPNPLTEGEEGKLTATDEAGNISGETVTGLADVVAPDVPAVDSNNASGLTGTGEAGTTITLTKPNGDKETTVVDENGQWSFAPNPLTEGEEGKLTATDEAGNISGETSTGLADVVAPDVPAVDSNNASGLTGTGEAGATITLTKPDGDKETTVVDENGQWSFAPNPLNDGEEGKLTATDEAGNISGEASTGTAVIDGPLAPVVDSNNGAGLTGTGEPGATITLTKPNGDKETTVVDENGQWSFAPNPLTEGEEGKLTATDEAGNISGETSTGLADVVAPDVPAVDSNNASGLTGTGEAGTTITLTKPNGDKETTVVDENGQWSFAPNPLTEGEEGKLTATDEAGNISGETSTGTAVIDGPLAPVVDSNNGAGLTGTGEPGATITLTKPNGDKETTVVDENGQWRFEPNPLTEGEEGKLTATDEAGNTSGETLTGSADVTAPDAPAVDSNNASGLTGTGEPGTTITLTKPDGTEETTVVDENGQWRFQPNPLTEGEEGKLTATDEAGNISGEASTGTAVIDGPLAPVVDSNNGTGLTGTGEPGTTITLTKPDGTEETTVVDENGQWSFAPNPLTEGEEGKLTATDEAGNISGETVTGLADVVAPDVPAVDSNNASGLTGTGEAGATITLTKPNGDKETTVVDENGQWRFEPNPLTEGEEGKLTATDEAGNISGETVTGLADVVAPDVPAVDSNNASGLTGTGEAGATITLTKPNGDKETTVVDENGQWRFEPNPLTEGEEGKLTATDEAGNISGETVTGLADVVAPDVPAVDSNNASGLTGTGEAGTTITLTKPNGDKETTVVDENGQWSFAPNPLTEGEEGKLTATDEAGNISGETSTGLADVVAPDVPAVDSNNASGLTGTGEAGATITLTKPDGDKETTVVDENGQWSFAPNPLNDGEEGKLTATDEAGNISGEASTGTAVIDGPLAPVVDSNNGAGLTGTGEPGATITLTKPNGDKETTVVDENGQWSFAPNPLTEGEEGKLTATDEAGNISGETSTGLADVVAPDVPAVDSNNASGLTGTGEAGTTITLTKPNGDKETTVVDENGQWSFAPNPLTEGEEGKLTATDEAGNISGETSTGTAVIDGPLAPVVDSNNGAGLTGTGEPGATITLTKPNGDKETTVVDENGQWRFEPNPLTEGEEGKLTATDEAGNTSGETLTGSADVTAPDAPAVDSNNASGLTGTGEPGTTITLTKPDGTEETTVVDENGQWRFQPNPLTEGEEGKLTATDEAGNISGEASTGTAVIDGPLAPVVDSNNGTGLTGTGEPGTTITLTKPDGTEETTVVDENGQWSFAPNPLTEGEEGKLTATDEAGNISGETVTGLADVVAPDVPAVDSNNASGLTGTGEAGATITLTKPNGDKETTVVDENGQWRFEPNPLTEGEEGKLTATDEAGNISGETVTGLADVVAPDVPAVDSNNASGLTGTGEAGATITLTKPNGDKETTVVDENGQWRFEPNPLTEGEEGKLTATDEAGNISGETVTGLADVVAPDVPAVDSNNASGLTGTGEAGTTITLTKPNGDKETTVVDENGQWSFAPNPLTEGEEGKLTATDEAGNISGETSTGLADVVAPDVPAVDSNNASGLTGTGEAGATITLTKPNGDKETTVVDENGQWSFAPNPLKDGEEGKLTATDEAGNTSGETVTDAADVTAPDAPVITHITDDQDAVVGDIANNGHTNDKTPTIHGTADANSTIIIYNNGEQIGIAIADGNGYWAFTPNPALEDGTYILTAIAKDAASNNSNESNDHIITIDTSVPAENTITIDGISEDAGVSASDFVTNDNTLVFNGSLATELKGNEQVQISMDGGLTWLTATVNGTNWSYDHTGTELADGKYDIQVQIVTLAGNAGSSANQDVIIDTTGDVVVEGLTSSFTISTDTSHGLLIENEDSHSSTATNNDLITRDQTLTVSGTLSAELDADSYLQISNDNGLTWTTIALNGLNWSYKLPEFDGNNSETYHLRVTDKAGNVANNTAFNDAGYTIIVDVDAPDGISLAPVLPESVNANTVYNYNSTTYGKVEAGAIVSLVNDVDGDGVYREGLDKVIGFVTADNEGNWNLATKLPAGSSNLGFVVWDAAGNHSGMSSSTSVGTTTGVGYAQKVQTWGATDTGYYGINVAAATLQGGQWVFYQTPDSTGVASTWNNGSLYFMQDTVNGDATYKYNYLSGGVQEAGYGGFLSGATMFDINRDGLIDVIGAKSGYGAPYKTSSWMQNADGSFTAVQVDTPNGVYQHLGGTIAIDITGDGYLDIFLSTSETSAAGANHIFTLLENKDGTLVLNNKLPAGANAALTMLHEVSGVDLNNDGTIEIAGHSNRTAANEYNNLGTSLTILQNNGTGLSGVTHYDNVFQNNGYIDEGDQVANMVWSDFNGDGYLDLFLVKGNKNTTATNESRIYLNDGQGNLLTSVSESLWFGDAQDGASSLAVDWNHDGKMDIIEISRSRLSASPTLYMNTGDNVWNKADQKFNIASAGNYTGAIAMDYNWDGNVDLLLYTAGKTVLVENTNAVADGTSLNISIADGNGINAFFGNTVHLYDSKGNLVATQVLNPQASGTNVSSGLLNFYGLDAKETYSLQMLRVTNGVANHIGSGNNLGGYNETTVNAAWGNITTGKANQNLALTVEKNTDANHSLGNGITGTGYNDTFFATEGNDIYNGGGGWNNSLTGQKVWSATGGLDTVDYSSAKAAINANLTTGTVTGMGSDKLISIEGLVGSQFNDTFVDSVQNNVFEGKGGNDSFHLTNGGNDTLLYKLLNVADATAGNGSDTVYDFHIGAVGSNANADVIDIRGLLNYNGVVSFYTDEGEKKLDYNSKDVLNYIKTEVINGNTVISIDRDGEGGSFEFTNLVTLNNTETDLLTLLTNNQVFI